MEKRISARAILIEDEYVHLMFRRKTDEAGNVSEYYAIPGGGVEGDATIAETILREMKEEFSIDVKILGYLGNLETDKTVEHYFRVEIVNGIPTLGGEELDRMSETNYYEVRKVLLSEINEINLLPKEMVLKAMNRDYINLV